jgi:heterodisulfide reductase subunit C
MRIRISAAQVQSEFVRQVEYISNESMLACNQCGKCSAGCPIAFDFDLLPSQVIRLVQLGVEEVLESQAIWTCAACLTCVARCPKGIDLPRIMEALRLIAMQRGGDHMETNQLSAEMMGQAPQLALIGGFRKFTT